MDIDIGRTMRGLESMWANRKPGMMVLLHRPFQAVQAWGRVLPLLIGNGFVSGPYKGQLTVGQWKKGNVLEGAIAGNVGGVVSQDLNIVRLKL
jgi:hypothetical protein